MHPDQIARTRRFYRAETTESGVLDSSYLGLGRPLVETEVRVRETIARRKPLGPAPPPADPPAPAPSTLEDA